MRVIKCYLRFPGSDAHGFCFNVHEIGDSVTGEEFSQVVREIACASEVSLIRFSITSILFGNYDGSDSLINLARQKLDKICELYLEEL
jgi:hypothetical protein